MKRDRVPNCVGIHYLSKRVNTDILIVTHPEIGRSLYNTAKKILGNISADVNVVEVGYEVNPVDSLKQIIRTIACAHQSRATLILCDLIGATPFNVVNNINVERYVRIVAGLNLPMLLSVLNYPELSLDNMVEKEIASGTNAIQAFETSNCMKSQRLACL